MNHRRITKTCFRTCFCRRSRSQAGLCLYTFTTMSIGRKPTFVPLRYFLARIRPRQTDHLALSPTPRSGVSGKISNIPKRGITLAPEGSLLFLTIKMHKSILNFSKAPRGLFVLVEVGRVFTAIAISPSKGSRQLLTRYAIRAGRNLPDKELRYRRTVIVTAAVYRSFGSEPSVRRQKTHPFNLPALGRHQPVYLTFRFCTDLCF